MPNIINWERASVTSNIAVTIPRANYPELVFTNEDDHGNVVSCKDGAILSDFTVIERRPATPAVETDTQDDECDGTLWSVAEYEKRGLVMVSTDKIVPGDPGLVCEFGWRECGSGQSPDDYKGKIETEGEYWRPVLVHWQKPGPAKTPEVIGKVGDAVSLDIISQTGDSAEVSVGYKVETATAVAPSVAEIFEAIDKATIGLTYHLIAVDLAKGKDVSVTTAAADQKKPHVTKEEQLFYLVTQCDEWPSPLSMINMSKTELGATTDSLSDGYCITYDEWEKAREEYLTSLDQAYPGDIRHGVVEVKASTGERKIVDHDFTDRVEMTDEQIAIFKENWTAIHRLNKGGFVGFTEMHEVQKEQLRPDVKLKLHGISGQHPTPLSVDILNQAIEAQRDRAATYDSPTGERSMGKTVAMFRILHGFDLTEEQGWQFMELLKMARSSQGDFKLDNYVDGSGYASLAGDAAYRERGEE